MEHIGLLFLFTCQPTHSSNFSRSDANVRAQLLSKNYSRDFSSIRSGPRSRKIVSLENDQSSSYSIRAQQIVFSINRKYSVPTLRIQVCNFKEIPRADTNCSQWIGQQWESSIIYSEWRSPSQAPYPRHKTRVTTLA